MEATNSRFHDLTQPHRQKRLPFYLKSVRGAFIKVPIQVKNDKGQIVTGETKVVGDVILDIIQNENDPVQVGDTVYNCGQNGVYVVIEVSGHRPAKGEYQECYGFVPQWCQAKAVFSKHHS